MLHNYLIRAGSSPRLFLRPGSHTLSWHTQTRLIPMKSMPRRPNSRILVWWRNFLNSQSSHRASSFYSSLGSNIPVQNPRSMSFERLALVLLRMTQPSRSSLYECGCLELASVSSPVVWTHYIPCERPPSPSQPRWCFCWPIRWESFGKSLCPFETFR